MISSEHPKGHFLAQSLGGGQILRLIIIVTSQEHLKFWGPEYTAIILVSKVTPTGINETILSHEIFYKFDNGLSCSCLPF